MSEHYYTTEGKACHQVPNKSKGGLRDTTLSDAKKLGLLPSVSAYVRMLAAPGLVSWQIEEAVKAAANAPIQPGENVDEYVKAIREKASQQVGDAADLGTRIHKALEDFFLTGKAAPDDLLQYVEPAIAKVGELGVRPITSECVLVNAPYGYAGTTDLIFDDAEGSCGILDFKSKKTKPGEKPFKSFEHRMQLSAYWMANWGPNFEMTFPASALAYNVYISTTEPGRVDAVKYDDTDLREAWDGFKACLALYRYTKGYDARVK